jgi:hypothetical protein
MPIVSLAELKTYLGLVGTGDDQLLETCIVSAQGRIERDTGRVFAYSSNVTRTYSSEGQAAILIRDVPSYASNISTVTLSGATMAPGTGFWLLPDRRNPEVSITLQLRPFDTSRPGWYKASPNWWDANMDSERYAMNLGMPNDVIISGPEGHPNPQGDVVSMHKVMAALLYWQAKSGASGTVSTPTGEVIDLSADPIGYAEFVRVWRARTAVANV